MDDLRDRFGRLDRIDAPDLWDEAVERAADPDELTRPIPDLGTGATSYAIRITLAAASVLTVALIGINLVINGGGKGVGGPTEAPSSVASPTPPPTPTLEPAPIDVGFIGLPPPGAAPSTPESGELVTSLVNRGNHPSMGWRVCTRMAG